MRFSLRAKRIFTGAAAGALVLSMLPAGVASAGIEEVCANAPDSGFSDKGTTHADNIDCMYAYDVMQGRTDGTFGTFDYITRGATAAVLVNFAVAAWADIDVPNEEDPFTDKGNVFDEEINALWNLGLTDGATATTYEPAEFITRGQFAKLLYEAHVVLGTEFDDSYPEAFPDAGDTFGDEINALAGEGIIEGYSDGTFGTWDNITRGQVISLLAESAGVLDDDGNWDADRLPPTGTNQSFTVTPDDEATVEVGDIRQYSVSDAVADTEHTIALFPADAVSVDDTNGVVTFVDDNENGRADDIGDVDAEITVVNGATITAAQQATTEPVGNSINFTIEGVSAESVVPVVFFDANENLDLNVDADGAPVDAEPFGIGGVTVFQPEEAAVFSDQGGDVIEVGDGYYTLDTTATPDGVADVLVQYEAGDAFTYQLDGITMAQFEAWLSVGDYVDVNDYNPGATDHDLSDDVPNAPTNLTATVGDFDGVASTDEDDDVRVTFDASTGGLVADYTVDVYEDDDDADTACEAGTLVAGATDTDDGSPLVVTDLDNDTYCAVVHATSETADDSDLSDPVVFTVQVGTADETAPTIDDLDYTDTNSSGVTMDGTDVITFDFSEDMTIAGTDADIIRFTDADGATYQLTNTTNATFLLVAGDDTTDVLTVTLTGAPTQVAGSDGTNPGAQLNGSITAISTTVDDVAGNDVDLAASDDIVIDNEF